MNVKSKSGIVAAFVTISLSLSGAPALADEANANFVADGVSNGIALESDSGYLPVVGSGQISLLDEAMMARDPRVAELEEGLTIIDEIPESVLLQGDEALTKWFDEHPASVKSGPLHASVAGCAKAIGLIVAGGMVAPAKLLKIKKYIKAVGGVTKAVEAIWKAGFNLNKLAKVGGALGGLIAEISGIADVKKECFK